LGSRRFSLLFCTGCSRVHDGSRGVPGNDSYEARGTECGYRGFGKIAPELLVAKGAIDNSLRKPAERVGGLSLRPMTRPQNGGSVGLVGYFGFLVDRIRSTAAFTVIPGSSSRATISSLVCPRLLASRMNTLSQAVLAANWWASISWNGVSWSLMAEGLYRLVPVSLYFLPLISIGLRGTP